MSLKWQGSGKVRVISVVIVACLVVLAALFSFRFLPAWLLPGEHLDYSGGSASSTPPAPTKPIFVATHVPTPEPVKAIYMTACVAGMSSLRNKLVSEISQTEINSLVIDLKDYTGTLSYASTTVKAPTGKGCMVYDLPQFVAGLHKAGIYVIGRITVFQDPLYAAAHPEIAVASASHPNRPWTDKKGLAYIDPDFPVYWDYIIAIAKEAHAIGFDELNFDYIRFPSDGDMTDARFALPASTTKAAAIADFFAYLNTELKQNGITMSADIFGQTTVNTDDMGIGQILEYALPYFDYVSPMVYPSHFINGFEGYADPAEHPYEIVKNTMTSAAVRAVAASSTPSKLRPWLQAFDLGAVYTPAMVHQETQAVYDSGLTGWMLWDAANTYDKEAL